MANSRKAKGTGYEREIVDDHRAKGVEAKRVPLSGALADYPGDVQIAGLIAECKRRRKNFTGLYKALEQQGADMLFVRDDRQETLVVLRYETWWCLLDWLKWAERYPARVSEVGASDQQDGEK